MLFRSLCTLCFPVTIGGSKLKGSGKAKQSEDKKASNVEENTMYKVTFMNKSGKKQTERMKGSTLQKNKSAGMNVQKVEPAGQSAEAADSVEEVVKELVILQGDKPTPEEIKAEQASKELEFEVKKRGLELLDKKEKLLEEIRNGIKQ